MKLRLIQGLAVLAIFGASCSSEAVAAPAFLDEARIHSQAAERMSPGSLAALQLVTLGDHFGVETRATTGARLWDFWANEIEQCAQGSEFQDVPRINVPDSDDPIWDLVREPTYDLFRPTGEEWNRQYGAASQSAKTFWADHAAFFEAPLPLDDSCVASTYPFATALSFEYFTSTGQPLDLLALNVLESVDLPVPPDGPELEFLPGHGDIAACIVEHGVDAELVESDYFEVFAVREGPHPEAAAFSVAEGSCIEQLLGPHDDELLQAVAVYSVANEELLRTQDVDALLEEWLLENARPVR